MSPAGRPPAGHGSRSSEDFGRGLAVREVLDVSSLTRARLLAGEGGLDRIVERLNVMEVPDVLPWVKPHELLLTTGYPLRDTPAALTGLVGALDDRGLAALAIKLGRYIDELPEAMLAEADRRDFPVILLPDDVGFDDILNQVLTGILNRQAAALARYDEVHRALVQIVLAGGGLDEVAVETASLLGGAVLLVGIDGRVLATAGPPADLEAARAAAAEVHNAPGTGKIGASFPDRDRFASVPVVAGTLDHGRLVAFRRDGALGSGAVTILERAATVAALVITQRLAVSAVESKYQSDLVRDLVEGRAIDAARLLTQSRSFGWDLERPLVVVVSELEPPASAGTERQETVERLAVLWRSAVRSWDPVAAVVAFSDEVVTLLGADDDARARRVVEAVAARVGGELRRRGWKFSVGIGRVCHGLAALPAGYAQARRSVQVGRQMHGPGEIAHFNDLGVFRLLSLVPEGEELRSYVGEVLGPLAWSDDAEAVDLRETLQVLLETNLNVAEASRRLHFHYNTLRYRIGKLERTLGPFSQDPDLRLNLMLALQVIRMRGIAHKP
ncbi:MAG: PucR family transcriptional regulator ligand-binding domain-containing protein [Geodermatophilaceae bacterium]|jgi:purine catabolism regulator|nr:PucR family transcriptional regulator ligand-binding domain-containing protein [Geodermatophilaceae bacterium]MDQ3464450.1 PucR family transcriptional regulator ligand-binding domain-containing protein [Actinomycetota bacterium]